MYIWPQPHLCSIGTPAPIGRVCARYSRWPSVSLCDYTAWEGLGFGVRVRTRVILRGRGRGRAGVRVGVRVTDMGRVRGNVRVRFGVRGKGGAGV